MPDLKISQLTAAATLTGTELIELVQSGGNVRSTLNALASFIGTGSSGVTSFNSRTGTVTLTASDVTTALSYTPISNALASANILVGSAGNVATSVSMSGDATISNTGVISVTKILGNAIPVNASGYLFNNGSGVLSWATPSGGGGSSLARTSVKTANYTANINELVPCDITLSAFTITLPNAPADKSQVEIKIILPTTVGSFLLTIACAGSDVINRTGGTTSTVLTLPGEAALFQYDSANAIWTKMSNDISLSLLDTRYSYSTTISNSLSFQSPLPGLFNVTPSTGSATFRALENTDIPAKTRSKAPMYGVLQVFGDSLSLSQQASPLTNGVVDQLAVKNSVTVNNQAVSGKGVVVGAIASYSSQPIYYNTNPTFIFCGFNDLRRGGSASATLNKITGCTTSMIANALLRFAVPASGATNTGTWTNWTTLNGKAVNLSGNGRQSSTIGDTITYTTTEKTDSIVIGLWGSDGTTNNFGRVDIAIDGTTLVRFDPNGKADAQNDGTTDNALAPWTQVFTGLGNTTHAITLTVVDAKTTVIDYIGYMNYANACPSVFVLSPPRMNATGYAIAPASANDTVITTGKNTIKTVVNTTFANYFSVLFADNDLTYDISTGLGADSIHPNNVGYTYLATNTQTLISSTNNFLGPWQYITSPSSQVTGSLRFGVNRNPSTGVFYNTGMAAAGININAAALDGNITFFTSVANNAITQNMILDKNGRLLVGYATPATTEQMGVQKNQNAGTIFAVTNTTSGTASIASVVVSGSATLSSSISMTEVSAAFTTSGINVATAGVLNSSLAGGLNVGTSGATQLSFWTNNIKKGSVTSGGLWRFGDANAGTALVHLAPGTTTANTAPLKFTSGTNMTATEAGAVEYDGTNLFLSDASVRYMILKVISNSATLDFPSTAANATSDLTITVTGAVAGEEVVIGTPTPPTGGSYTAWVSASNTVTIRFTNSTIGALDPASATFRASVIKR